MIRLGLTSGLLLSLHSALRGCVEHDRGLWGAARAVRPRSRRPRRTRGPLAPPPVNAGDAPGPAPALRAGVLTFAAISEVGLGGRRVDVGHPQNVQKNFFPRARRSSVIRAPASLTPAMGVTELVMMGAP